ncbi:hypothetical protein MMC29_002060 [Sticta canariensis]|nr:hypothetical protein [Sticta canariensis]
MVNKELLVMSGGINMEEMVNLNYTEMTDEYVSMLKWPRIQTLLKVRGIQELDVNVVYGGFDLTTPQDFYREEENFMQAMQMLKEPRDFKKQRRLPSRELWAKVPLMTRASASQK